MQLIRKKAFARAGLIGNPSDGYNGKTISISVRNFCAQISLYEWDRLELVPSQEDQSRFRSIHELAQDVLLHGYYGGIRLVKATIKKFVEFCDRHEIELHDRNFSIRYESNIPRQVGLAGSSAIIVATLRALIEFYEIDIPKQIQPSLVLSVEQEELGITAGLQDRVIQIFEGCVYMDFSKSRMAEVKGYQCGYYEPLQLDPLPPIYIAYNTDVGEPTEVLHNHLRARYLNGDRDVVDAMGRFAELADLARAAIQKADWQQLGMLIDENFNLRRSICRLHSDHEAMVEAARACGASAKFAGSGGAIIGLYYDEAIFERLQKELGKLKCSVIRPGIYDEPE